MQASASVTASGDSKAAIGEALKQALSGNRLQSISLHDERGDVLWLDEGALGPDEHNLVLDAASALAESADRNFHFISIGDGRAAAFLPSRSPLNDLLGLAMIIADAKFLDAKGAAKFVTPTTTNLMRRLAFLRRPPAPAAPATPPPPANKVVSPPAQARAPAARPPAPPAGARPAAPAARPPGAPQPQRPAAPPTRPGVPSAAARPAQAPARPATPAAKAPLPSKPAAPAQRPAAPSNMQQRTSGSAETDSIAFEISDIDPKALLKPAAKQAPPVEAKRPELRVIQTDRLPRLELRGGDPMPELIPDEPPPQVLPQIDATEEVTSEEETTEVEALDDPENNMNVEPVYVDETPELSPGAGQFEFYGQIFELHVQQLVKLKGSGGTRRYEVLVRDAHADNEFGTAPERVVQDAHDPSANSDLDRIVIEQLVRWMAEHRGAWETEPASFSVNVGMGTIADPKFVSYVAGVLKNQKVPAKALGFEISEKSCVEQVREVDLFIQACEKLGCHVVLDDFTFHHNAMRWLGSSALKFVKMDAKITSVAMKEKVPQAVVVAVTQASKVLGLSCVAKRVDTPAQRDWLSAVGLDYAQGFLLDQPKSLISLAPDAAK
ncbi:MAG TPA: EAL domain-containing protein [Steroidobacteraceae bacterium]|nr:EAL domain-containing protein [Steroidobacteraceae bacterium]